MVLETRLYSLYASVIDYSHRLKFYHVYISKGFFFFFVVSFLSLTDENFVPWTVEIYKSYRMLMMYMGLVEMVSTG